MLYCNAIFILFYPEWLLYFVVFRILWFVMSLSSQQLCFAVRIFFSFPYQRVEFQELRYDRFTGLRFHTRLIIKSILHSVCRCNLIWPEEEIRHVDPNK